MTRITCHICEGDFSCFKDYYSHVCPRIEPTSWWARVQKWWFLRLDETDTKDS